MDEPIFKHGQYVRTEDGEFFIPDHNWYVENRISNRENFLDDLSDDEYAKYFLQRNPRDICIDCSHKNTMDGKRDNKHWEYDLLQVDQYGNVTFIWNHHVCEEKIKLSKKNMHKNP